MHSLANSAAEMQGICVSEIASLRKPKNCDPRPHVNGTPWRSQNAKHRTTSSREGVLSVHGNYIARFRTMNFLRGVNMRSAGAPAGSPLISDENAVPSHACEVAMCNLQFCFQLHPGWWQASAGSCRHIVRKQHWSARGAWNEWAAMKCVLRSARIS